MELFSLNKARQFCQQGYGKNILNSLQNGFDFLRNKIVQPLGLGADISGLAGMATNVTGYHLQEIVQ